MLPSPGALIDMGEVFSYSALNFSRREDAEPLLLLSGNINATKLYGGNVSFQSMISTCQSSPK